MGYFLVFVGEKQFELVVLVLLVILSFFLPLRLRQGGCLGMSFCFFCWFFDVFFLTFLR